MSKYTRKELRDMACFVLHEAPVGKAIQFYIEVSRRSGLNPSEVRDRTVALCEGGIDDHV